jgi:hypothetical protein
VNSVSRFKRMTLFGRPGMGKVRGRAPIQRRSARGPYERSGLLEPSNPNLQSLGVGADQPQVEPLPRDQPDVRSIFLPPAELEQITGFLDRDSFPRAPNWLSSMANTR